MANGDPMGIGDPIGRDMERVSRALGRGPLPQLTMPRGSGQPAASGLPRATSHG